MGIRRTKLWVGVAALFLPGALLAQNYSLNSAPNTRNAVSPLTGVDDQILAGFYPQITVAATRHSNSRRVADLEEAETVISIIPMLAYKTDIGSSGRHSFQVNYRAISKHHDNFSNEDSLNHVVDAALVMSITDKLQASVNVAYASGTEDRSGSGAPVVQSLVPNEFKSTLIGAQATYGNRENRMQLSLGVEAGEYRYTNNNQEIRDYDRSGIWGRVNYNVGAVTTLFLDGGIRDIDYIHPTATRDSTETYARLGVDWEPSVITRASVAIGQTDKEFDDPSEEDFSGLTYFGRLFWSPLEYTDFSLYGSRTVEESPEAEVSYFVSTLWGLSGNYAFSSRLSAFAFANYTQDEFNNGRTDDIEDVGLGLSYNFRPWLFMSAQYGTVERDSNELRANYEDQYFTLSLTARRP